MRGIEGPDFICVGLPKAGTGWLFDQLNAHPDFWMPPVKELLYLMSDFQKMRFVKPSGEPAPNKNGLERRVHREVLDERDRGFLQFAATCRNQLRDLGRYATLFSFKGDLLSGDISPPYWNLESEMIERVAARFPKTRIVLIVRDPVTRAMSRMAMAYRADLFNPRLLQNERKFRKYLTGNNKIGALSAVDVVKSWQTHAPDMAFGTFFFDAIAADPEGALRDILTFLGADPSKERKGALAAGYNRKAGAQGLEMTDMAKAVLVENFTDELRAGAKLFGGPAVEWAKTYGV